MRHLKFTLKVSLPDGEGCIHRKGTVVYPGWCQSVIGVFDLDLGWLELDTLCWCVWVRFSVCLSLSNRLSEYGGYCCILVTHSLIPMVFALVVGAGCQRGDGCKSFLMSLIMSEELAFVLSASASAAIRSAVWGPRCFSAWFSPLTALPGPDNT